ncbi:oligosaccharide flippase family protein [Vibrio kanaloae]|uniref:oligosaccharide flippase family protein n=1 Tax=Vibrio kanaloae TaxID=170673 RepID=UPI001EFE77A7|nr:oligosaccharide flippase family protein [Vibrio kanaloae]MCG9559368.1 oligosaccharide flippase family protein [Vibrio kanaloae]
MNNILKKAIVSSFLAKNSAYLIQVLSLAITARLFSPQDFGVLATLALLVQFFFVLGEGGIGTALISANKVTKSKRDCMFTLSAIISLIFCFLFFIATPILASYFQVDYGASRHILTFAIFFSLLSMVPVAILRRELWFILLGKIEVAAEIISLLSVILLWKLGFRLEAIASRFLVIGVIKFFVVIYFTSASSLGMPHLTKDFRSLNTFLRVSSYQFLYSIVNYISRVGDNFAVGRIFDMSTLGFYEKAYQLMRYPMMLISISVSPAIQSVMARERSDLESFSSTYENIERKLFVLGSALGLLFFINSELLVLLMFGSDWLYVSNILSVFSIAIPFLLLQGISGGFFQALSDTKLLFYVGVFSLTSNLVAILIGIYLGTVIYLSYCLVVSFLVTYIVTHLLLYFHLFKVRGSKQSIRVLIMLVIYFVIFSVAYHFSGFFDINNTNGLLTILFIDVIFTAVSLIMLKNTIRNK